MKRILLPMLVVFTLAVGGVAAKPDERTSARKGEYVTAVTGGAGLLPWQQPYPSEAEQSFREDIEQRKEALLASRVTLEHPVMLRAEDIQQARRNILSTDWANSWFTGRKQIADFIADQPEDSIEKMIPELSPGHLYGFTCPNCVGRLSQEGAGSSLLEWSHQNPNVIRCRKCGHIYPSDKYPESATLACPRTGQEFTYYLNEEEQLHPEDRSGRHAYHWVGYPMHMSFSGIVRYEKVQFMVAGLHDLALAYAITGERRYGQKAVQILVRLADCYRNWLYRDYWDTIADADPMYVAWHDRNFPLEWKRHLCEEAFANDTLERAAMLQSYWGAGRYHPSTDAVSAVATICQAYDLVHDVKASDGRPLWTPEMREKVEKDLILEWIIGGEPFVGGSGEATCVNNKAPRVYNAMAAAAVCLGLPGFADTALRGYEAVRDESFLFDGFSRESPAYTNMYLAQLLLVPETLFGFRWPEGFKRREGTVNLYATDSRLRLMLQAVLDQLRPDGRYLPLGDTGVGSRPSPHIAEIGLHRYPEHYQGTLPTMYRDRSPGDYAALHLNAEQVAEDEGLELPEVLFPGWMTAILRHGSGPDASLLSLTFSPSGGHRHTDNLALFYVDGGDTILGDHGYVGDMPVNRWIHSTFSHNLVIVDDEEQRFGGRGEERIPRLSMMFTSPQASVAEASSEGYDQCREYRRLVALIKGPGSQTFAVDIFRVKGGGKHDYRVFCELASSDAEGGSLEFHGIDVPPEPPLPDVGGSLEEKDIFGLRDTRRNTAPPTDWQAVWKEPGRSYRLWMLGETDEVQASNGPGQEFRDRPGRRVRYLDVIRTGEDLSSTFVAVHEPSGLDGRFPISNVTRADLVTHHRGDAVAIWIESDWGSYMIIAHAEEEIDLSEIHFRGKFGVYCEENDGAEWLLACGAEKFRARELGFSGRTPCWRGTANRKTDYDLVTGTPRPADWPAAAKGCQNYVVVDNGNYMTGFPVEKTDAQSMRVARFPLPEIHEFELPALRFVTD